VEGDGFPHLAFGVFNGVAEGDAAGEVRSPGAVVAVGGGADEDDVRVRGAQRSPPISKPAWRRMLRSSSG